MFTLNQIDWISAAQLRSVTEIAPKSPFLCVNRSPIRLIFVQPVQSVFVRKISTKKRVTNEKTTKRFIEIYPQTRCSVNLMRQPINSRQCTSEKDTFYKPYRYCCCFFPVVKHLWGSLVIKTLCNLYVYIRHLAIIHIKPWFPRDLCDAYSTAI